MVIFGGTRNNGVLVDNDLYLLVISKESYCKGTWIKVKVDGFKPEKRYGHTMAFSNPYIFVIGG